MDIHQLGWLKHSLFKSSVASLISYIPHYTQALVNTSLEALGEVCRIWSPVSMQLPFPYISLPSDPLLCKFQSPVLPEFSAVSPQLREPLCSVPKPRYHLQVVSWGTIGTISFVSYLLEVTPLRCLFSRLQNDCSIFYLILVALNWRVSSVPVTPSQLGQKSALRDTYIVLRCCVLVFNFKNQERDKAWKISL